MTADRLGGHLFFCFGGAEPFDPARPAIPQFHRPLRLLCKRQGGSLSASFHAVNLMRTFLFLICALLAVPPAASAQVNSLASDRPREQAKVKLGPFYVTPSIALDEMGVDTNVLNQQTGPQSDFTFTVAPQARVWLPIGRRALVRTQGGADLVWYRTLESERSVNPQVQSRVEIYLRRMTLFGDGAFVYTRQRPTFEVDLRSRRRETAFSGGLDFRLLRKITLEVAGGRSGVRFVGDEVFAGTPLAITLNRDTTSIGSTLRYHWSPLTTFAFRAGSARDRFPLASIRDSDSLSLMPGVEFKPRALINGSAYVGVRRFRPIASTRIPAYTGLVADLDLAYTLLGSTSFAVTHTRGIGYSWEFAQPYFVDNSVGASVRRALGRRFDMIVSGARHQYAYRNLIRSAEPSTGERRLDTTWNYSGSFGYRMGRESRIGLGVSYWRRDSTTRQFREYDGLRIGMSGNYGF